jgi:zinc transport system ATP-binding protein
MTTSVLSVHDGGFSVQGRPLLRDIELEVHAGEVVALLGGNGSGKSTLVKAAVGLNRLTRGEVTLFGEPVARFRDWRRVGYVPQRNSAPPAVPATVGEVVASGRLSHKRPLAPFRAQDRAAVDEALAVVGLAERRHHAVSILSGGQQQRVLVARALAGRPELLILDEPNAGVDHASQRALAQALADRARHGTTILVVLHELGPFEPLISRLLLMREGRLVHDGFPDHAFLHGHEHGHAHHDLEGARPPLLPTPPVVGPLEGDA